MSDAATISPPGPTMAGVYAELTAGLAELATFVDLPSPARSRRRDVATPELVPGEAVAAVGSSSDAVVSAVISMLATGVVVLVALTLTFHVAFQVFPPERPSFETVDARITDRR